MRRAPIVLSATVAGTAGVLAFHAHTPARTVAALATPAATATASSSATASPSATKTATSDPVATQYGDVQLEVTVSGNRITGVQALQLPTSDPRSYSLSSYAEPLLRQSALSKQNGEVDVVSGATYTSDGYRQALQSALDKAGFRA